jgi:CysZ protein
MATENENSVLAAVADGFLLPLRAAALLIRHSGLKRHAILPLIVNLFAYAIAVATAVFLLWHWDLRVPQWEFLWWFGAALAWVLNLVLALLKWVVAIPLIMVVCYFTFTIVGMILASPFNDMMSQRVECAVCGQQDRPRLALRQNVRVTVLSVLDSAWIVFLQLLFMLLAVPFLFVPVLGAVPLFLIVAYFTGLGFLDTSMARNLLRHRHKRPAIAAHRWRLLGLGLGMEVLFMIPFAGLLMLPVGVAAGTLLYCDCDWPVLLRTRGLEVPHGFVPPNPA